MGNPDNVCFSVDTDCYLVGVGSYGCSGVYKARSFITAGKTSTASPPLAEVEFEISIKSSGDIENFTFDEPILLTAGEQYHWCQEHKNGEW